MAAALKTFFVPRISSPYRIPVFPRIWIARWDASNSTGRVTSWNNTPRENSRIHRLIKKLLLPKTSPMMIIGQAAWVPKFATGTRAFRKRSGK